MPVCRDALGMEDGTIEDGDITASSYQQSWPPWAARLNGDSAWVPSSPFEGSWIQVDLGQQKTVSGVITQGYDRNPDSWWVAQYQMRYLNIDGVWTKVTSLAGNTTFLGNTGPNGQETNIFDRPIVTQKIQLYPTAWWREPGLRMELLGCDFFGSTAQPTISNVIRKTSTGSIASQSASPASNRRTLNPQTTEPISSVTSSRAALFDEEDDQLKNPMGLLGVAAIVGVAAGVAVVLIALLVFVIVLRKRNNVTNRNGSTPQDVEMTSNDAEGGSVGPYIDDGEYVDTLRPTITSPPLGDDVDYMNTVTPSAPPGGHYQELQHSVYQSLQQSGNDVGYMETPLNTVSSSTPPGGHYQELQPSVYQNLPQPGDDVNYIETPLDTVSSSTPPGGHYQELQPSIYQNLQQPGFDVNYMETPRDTVTPSTPPGGDYQELQPSVCQSLQQPGNDVDDMEVALDTVTPSTPPGGHYQELQPSVYQSLQKY